MTLQRRLALGIMDRSFQHKCQFWCLFLCSIVIIAVWSNSSNKAFSVFGIPGTGQGSRTKDGSGVDLERDPDETTSIPPLPIDSPTDAILNNLQSRIDVLEKQIQKMKDGAGLQTNNVYDKLIERIERTEDAAFSDGSNAFIAVMENAFFSPTGKRWVKLCEWEDCQFQNISEAAIHLLGRFKNYKTSSPIRAVHLRAGCPGLDNAFAAPLLLTFDRETIALGSVSSPSNTTCNATSFTVATSDELLEKVKDKSLDVLVVEGNGKEDEIPIIQALLKAWSVKLRVGGVALGQDYVVTKPFNTRWKPQIVATRHQMATKAAVDAFRTGDDNELGQEDTVRVAGGSLWYFVKIKPSIFG